ncbi:hypothetical protein Pelo_260 [Pelomyxa schiedti]|nr:hypothetical protein Pelo_260 [Pelomyxa schiedti]
MILSTLTRRSGCRRPVHVAAQSDFIGSGQNYCMYLLCFLPGNLPDGNLIQANTGEAHPQKIVCAALLSILQAPFFPHSTLYAYLWGAPVLNLLALL